MKNYTNKRAKYHAVISKDYYGYRIDAVFTNLDDAIKLCGGTEFEGTEYEANAYVVSGIEAIIIHTSLKYGKARYTEQEIKEMAK